MDAQIPFRRLVGYYATQLCYIVAGSAYLAFFILPEFAVIVSDLFWKIFVERQLRVVVLLLGVAAVVRYLFRSNEEETELPDLPFRPVYHSDDLQFPLPDLPFSPVYHSDDLQFPLPNLPPSHPPYPVHSSFSASFVGTTPPPSSPPLSFPSPGRFPFSFAYSDLPSHPPYPVHSSFSSPFLGTTPPPSSPPLSIPSPAHSFLSSDYSDLSSSPRSPPPPPFKMKPLKVFIQGDYAWLGSDASLSSDESDVDIKADRFITQFKRRLRSENRKTRMGKK